jgi:hypothetical protein
MPSIGMRSAAILRYLTRAVLVALPACGHAAHTLRSPALASNAHSPCSTTRGFVQPFVVENRAGGGGNPAAATVARVAPDGLTLLFASQAQAALNKFLYRSLPY